MNPYLLVVVCVVAFVIACWAVLKVSSIAIVRCAGGRTGPLYASGALVDTRQLRVDEGEDALTSYRSSPGNWRWFCRCCGSRLFVVIDQVPDERYYWATKLGDGARPGQLAERECHIHVASRAPWEPLDGELPRHDGIPARCWARWLLMYAADAVRLTSS